MTERRTIFGIFWKDESLGVTEESVHAQNAHFDIKPKRVKTRWGDKGWLVGYGTTICNYQGHDIGGTDRFVLIDGVKVPRPFHANSIEDD